METLFLVLTVLCAAFSGMFLLMGYRCALRGRVSPPWLQRCKWIFLIGFFVFWFLWDRFRILP